MGRVGWLAVGLGVVALFLSAARPTETHAFAVDQLEQAGQVVNNTTSSPPCHTTNFGIEYYQFYTDSEYRVGKALHVFLFLGAGEGQPADYAVEADLDTQSRGLGTAPRVCQPCIAAWAMRRSGSFWS
jgi:hypothetical protein